LRLIHVCCFFIRQGDARLKFEKNFIYIILLRVYTKPKKGTVDDFRLKFACEMPVLSVYQESANILRLHLPWYRFCMVEVCWKNRSSCSSLIVPRFFGKTSKCQSNKCTFKNILHPVAL